MNSEEREIQELTQRMRIAMQKAGYIIPSDLDVDEELPTEAMEASIPKRLSDIDAAMKYILGDKEDSKVVEFPEQPDSAPFAIAARHGAVKLSDETLNKLKRKDD